MAYLVTRKGHYQTVLRGDPALPVGLAGVSVVSQTELHTVIYAAAGARLPTVTPAEVATMPDRLALVEDASPVIREQ